MLNINPSQESMRISVYRVLDNGVIVHKYSSAMSLNYIAYEPSSCFGNHRSITHHETYGWLGNIATRRIPAELELLPAGSSERYRAVKAHHRAAEAQAEAYIRQAFPQDFVGE